MDETSDIRRKRLLYRSAHRGTREADLLLGAFAEVHLPHWSDAEMERFAAFLECSDGDIFDWLTGRAPPPPEQAEMVRRLGNFRLPPPTA